MIDRPPKIEVSTIEADLVEKPGLLLLKRPELLIGTDFYDYADEKTPLG
ncbi:MAG: hypothetical protein P4L50_20155 [Anaerolineaceae bacterium]|nr:hypothetical protein [Anaerolineaceae bacterium]